MNECLQTNKVSAKKLLVSQETILLRRRETKALVDDQVGKGKVD